MKAFNIHLTSLQKIKKSKENEKKHSILLVYVAN